MINNEKKFTASERRVLISHWVGAACEKLLFPRYDALRLACFRNTGCLITANGVDDDRIKPQGLPDYVVPPPSILEPDGNQNQSNYESVSPFIEQNPPAEFNPEQELVCEEDIDIENTDDEDNVFDIFDHFLFENTDE